MTQLFAFFVALGFFVGIHFAPLLGVPYLIGGLLGFASFLFVVAITRGIAYLCTSENEAAGFIPVPTSEEELGSIASIPTTIDEKQEQSPSQNSEVPFYYFSLFHNLGFLPTPFKMQLNNHSLRDNQTRAQAFTRLIKKLPKYNHFYIPSLKTREKFHAFTVDDNYSNKHPHNNVKTYTFLQRYQPSVIMLAEVFDQNAANTIAHELKELYPHVKKNIGAATFTTNSGLMLLSQFEVLEEEFIPFDNVIPLSPDWVANKGFYMVKLKVGPKDFVTHYFTHLTAGRGGLGILRGEGDSTSHRRGEQLGKIAAHKKAHAHLAPKAHAHFIHRGTRLDGDLNASFHDERTAHSISTGKSNNHCKGKEGSVKYPGQDEFARSFKLNFPTDVVNKKDLARQPFVMLNRMPEDISRHSHNTHLLVRGNGRNEWSYFLITKDNDQTKKTPMPIKTELREALGNKFPGDSNSDGDLGNFTAAEISKIQMLISAGSKTVNLDKLHAVQERNHEKYEERLMLKTGTSFGDNVSSTDFERTGRTGLMTLRKETHGRRPSFFAANDQGKVFDVSLGTHEMNLTTNIMLPLDENNQLISDHSALLTENEIRISI